MITFLDIQFEIDRIRLLVEANPLPGGNYLQAFETLSGWIVEDFERFELEMDSEGMNTCLKVLFQIESNFFRMVSRQSSLGWHFHERMNSE